MRHVTADTASSIFTTNTSRQRWILHSRHQLYFSINVWAGIVGGYLVSLRVLPHRLTGNQYRDFLLHDPPKQLAVRERMWYMHDGTPAHSSLAMGDGVSNTYRDGWICRGVPIAWPPHSPDFSPLDFYLWRHLKIPLHATPVETKRHFTIALWMPVRLSVTILTSLNGLTDHVETCRPVHWISWRTFWALL
jgi:hypothetical protein